MLNLENYLSQLLEIQKQHQLEMQEKVKNIFRDFFENNPGITVIKWLQYRDFWNDGEPCEFYVRQPYYSNVLNVNELLPEGDIDTEQENAFLIDEYTEESYDGVNLSQVHQLSKFLQSNKVNGLMEWLFGNDVCVTVTKDKIIVEAYNDHD